MSYKVTSILKLTIFMAHYRCDKIFIFMQL